MGKVVGKILEFGSLAALAVVTAGVGIGLAAGWSLGASISAVTATLGSTLGIGAAAAGGLALTGLSTLASIIGKPSVPKPSNGDSAIKAPTPPRQGAYGRCGLIGPYVFYQTDPNSGVAADVYAVHDNWWAPIDGVEGFYLADDRVASGPGIVAGLPDDSYSDGKVEIDFRLGNRVNSVFTQIRNLFPSWTDQARGDGVATAMVTWQPVKAKHYTKYYPKQQPVLRTIARWSKVYDWRDASQSVTDPLTWKWSENPVLHYVHYQLIRKGRQPTEKMVINGVLNAAWVTSLATILQAKWDNMFAPTLDMWTAAADDCDSDSAVPLIRVVTLDKADDGDHTIKVQNTKNLWNGASVTFSALDNITHTETKTVASFTDSSITFTSSLAYDHPLGSAVTWEADDDHPLYEPRYRSCVSHTLTTAHKDTEAAIIATFDGWVAPRDDGALMVYGGRYYEPTVSIGPDQIVSHSFEDGLEAENAINQLTLTYIDAALNYNAVDCTPWTDDDAVERLGRVADQTLQNQVPSYTQARRLAKRAMQNINAPYRGTVTTNAAGYGALGQRYIHLTIKEGGTTWYDGPAEITQLTRNLQTGGVTFQWVQANPDIDSWDPATEAGDPAPVGNVVSAVALAAPTITAATANFGSDSASGTSGVYLDLTIAGLDREDVTWRVRTRIAGNATWSTAEYDDVDAGPEVEIETSFVATDTHIEVEACYQVSDGRISDWSDSVTVDTSSSHIAPSRVTGLTATGGVGTATVAWNNPTSSNLASERLYASTTDDFDDALLAGTYTDGAGIASSHAISRSAGTWYFWVTTVSTSGAESSPVGPVSAVVTPSGS